MISCFPNLATAHDSCVQGASRWAARASREAHCGSQATRGTIQCRVTIRGEPQWQNVSRGILDPAGSMNHRDRRQRLPPHSSPLPVVADLHHPESLFNPELTCEFSPVLPDEVADGRGLSITARPPPDRSSSMPAIRVREARSSSA